MAPTISWAKWPMIGFFRISSGKFVRMDRHLIREAMPAEQEAFAKAKQSGVECVVAAGKAPTTR